MEGTFSVANHNGDIQVNWTDQTVWFDFDGATPKEKKYLSKFVIKGRKSDEWDAYVADEKGEPVGDPIRAFPKKASRIVLKRKPFEIKDIVESFVNKEIEMGGKLVFEMSGKGNEGRVLRAGEFKVKDKPEKKQEVVASRVPGGG